MRITAEEAHLLDGALHAIGTAIFVVEEDRLRPKRHRTQLVVLEAAHAGGGDDRLIVIRPLAASTTRPRRILSVLTKEATKRCAGSYRSQGEPICSIRPRS
jgi:hypothetical protein